MLRVFITCSINIFLAPKKIIWAQNQPILDLAHKNRFGLKTTHLIMCVARDTLMIFFSPKIPPCFTLKMPKLPLYNYEKVRQSKKYKKPLNYMSFSKKPHKVTHVTL
jgi:hypothetical protein